MINIRDERPTDNAAREALLDACFGEERFEKTCERLREGRAPADRLSLVLQMDGRLVGTVRLWHVTAGPNRPALLLGPIAVDPALQGLGLGAKLMRAALNRASALGHSAVLLVGDAAYYERFGFSSALAAGLRLPGPYERERFLALELRPGALAGAGGLVRATGARDVVPVQAGIGQAGERRGMPARSIFKPMPMAMAMRPAISTVKG
jgi:predicted N-acetyltransferase YhbS